MTAPQQEEDKDDLLALDLLGEEGGELTLEELEELEEEDTAGHKVQTFDPNDDGVDNYFDEKYFDE